MTKVSGNIAQLAILGIIVETGYKTLDYVYYNDGNTYIRKGVRDEMFVIDIRLTAYPGWNGIEDIDWENLRSIQFTS